jgi:hypothetical protein
VKGGSGEGGSSGGEVRVYDRRVDLGKELELVGRVGVVLRYVRVGSVSVEICLWMWMLYPAGSVRRLEGHTLASSQAFNSLLSPFLSFS